MKNVVVIGGGHGQSCILKGIKSIDNVNISAIVTVADDGGSTGRIRSYYSIPAMGDIRNVLIALMAEDSLLGNLMGFYFKGEENIDFIGHNLGNLIITAASEITGSFNESIKLLSKELKVKGNIIPSSLDVITLFAQMDDGTIVKGEANIPSFNQHINKIFYNQKVHANPEAIKAIEEADLIIYGIGSLYTSIIPNIIINGIAGALAKSKAKKVYFANCMTQPNETYDYDLKNHVDALIEHGATIDLVVKHNDIIPDIVRKRYLDTNSVEIIDHNDISVPVIGMDLLDFSNNQAKHSATKIKEAVMKLLED